MWFLRGRKPPAQPQLVLASNHRPPQEFQVAAKPSTDHSTGYGLVAITGNYYSKADKFAVESSYALGKSLTAHGKYDVTDEAVQSVGLESRFGAFGRHHTVDVKYAPQREGATMKLTMKQNRVRLSTTVNFDKLRSSKLKEHSEQYEMVAPLRALGTVKVWFDARSNAARFTLFRRLDYRNHFDAEYVYDRRGKRAVTLGMSHLYSPRHSFNLKANYGEKKYSVEWLCKTGNGPWSVKTDFSFDKSPHIGEWHIKRRFEF